jgi:hypothetical protein
MTTVSMLTACSRGTDPGGTPTVEVESVASRSGSSAVTDTGEQVSGPAVKALKSSAEEVRASVESVVRPLAQIATKREKTMDVAAPCELGSSGMWPQRWGYGVRAFLPRDHLAVASSALRTLRAEGWTVTDSSDSSEIVDVEASRGGMRLHILAEPSPASLLVEGYGTCVRKDGTAVSP